MTRFMRRSWPGAAPADAPLAPTRASAADNGANPGHFMSGEPGRIEVLAQCMCDDINWRSNAGSMSAPCTEAQIGAVTTAFRSRFGVELPQAYVRLLRRTNGIDYNGLTIWPAMPQPFMPDVIAANLLLQRTASDLYLYFGIRDDEMYVYDFEAQAWLALNASNLDEWARFDSADEMFTFMLQRAWGAAGNVVVNFVQPESSATN